MDILQVALVFLILLLAVLLSVLGIQVFFILRDLKNSLEKLDKVLSDAGEITGDVKKPIRAVSGMASAIEGGIKAVRDATSRNSKPARKLFRRR